MVRQHRLHLKMTTMDTTAVFFLRARTLACVFLGFAALTRGMAEVQAKSLVSEFLSRDSGIAAARAELASTLLSGRLGLAAASTPALSATVTGASGSYGFGDATALLQGSSIGVSVAGSLGFPDGSKVALSKAEERRAEARLALTELDRVAFFLQSCLDLVEARRRMEIEAQGVATFQELVRNAESDRKAGAGSSIAVLAAKQPLSAAQIGLEDSSSDLARKEGIVIALLGRQLVPTTGFEDLVLAASGPSDPGPWAASAAAEAALAQASLDRAGAAFSMTAGVSLSASLSPFATPPFGISAGGNLTLALNNPGSLEAAKAGFEAARIRNASELGEKKRAAERAAVDAGQAEVRVARFRDARDDAAAYLEAVEASFKAGASAIAEVLDARSALMGRDLALLSAEAQAARTRVVLLRQSGFPPGSIPRSP